MISKKLYNYLIYWVVLLKLIYLGIAILDKISINSDWSDKTKTFLNKLNQDSLTVTDFFMYIIIIIIFFPGNKAVDIVIQREEQIILFSLGIIGLIHTNWENFRAFFKKV
mgnify:CR=1 FL=1|tara:strand:- start:7414 stop:7743 length:330 start_codon:yes stop_codon:yes gene_type:complete